MQQREYEKRTSSSDIEKHISDIFKQYGEALLYLDTNEEILKSVA